MKSNRQPELKLSSVPPRTKKGQQMSWDRAAWHFSRMRRAADKAAREARQARA